MSEREENKAVLALIGAGGMLAQAVRDASPERYRLHGFDLPGFDLTDAEQVRHELLRLRPAVIVNCAAYTNVDGCETEQELASRVNGEGPGHLAAVALEIGAVLVHISTDYVFDGRSAAPYGEEVPPAPRSAYGRSKLLGEQRIRESGLERFFIIRTSWLYGPGGKNFVETMLRLAAEREELRVVDDQVGSPTFTGDLAAAIFELLKTEAYGIYHFANQGVCSWCGFARQIVATARQWGMELQVRQVVPISTEEFPLPAPRPAYSVLDTQKYRRVTGVGVPDWRTSLETYFTLR